MKRLKLSLSQAVRDGCYHNPRLRNSPRVLVRLAIFHLSKVLRININLEA